MCLHQMRTGSGRHKQVKRKKTHDSSHAPRILLIDSGVKKERFPEAFIEGETISFDKQTGRYHAVSGFDDENGHGTAVADAILSYCHDAAIYVLKLEIDKEPDEETLFFALEYALENVSCNIVNMSFGVVTLRNHEGMIGLLRRFTERGIVLVSAFDNEGAISYPAAYSEVIGVDVSSEAIKGKLLTVVSNSPVDILMSQRYYRLSWVKPERIIISGSSFAAGFFTGMLARVIEEHGPVRGKEEALKLFFDPAYFGIISFPEMQKPDWEIGKEFVSDIEKAVLFPFSKEMHALIRYEDMLPFEVTGVYDIPFSPFLGKKAEAIAGVCNGSEKLQIGNIEDVLRKGPDFDTIIMGHMQEIDETSGKDYSGRIHAYAEKHGLKLYSYDRIDRNRRCFSPVIGIKDVPIGRFGKLRDRTVPLLGVFGTGSRQGKYTVQLGLKQEMVQRGYKICHISTEPNGYLLGADAVYPDGYGISVDIQGMDAVMALNEMIWDTADKKGYDLLIAGGQSGVTPYAFCNDALYNFPGIEFLLGIAPDLVIIMINPFDDPEYINRTVRTITGLTEADVLCLILFPVMKEATKFGLGKRETKLSKKEVKATCKRIEDTTGLLVLNLDEPEIYEKLADMVIAALGEDDGI